MICATRLEFNVNRCVQQRLCSFQSRCAFTHTSYSRQKRHVSTRTARATAVITLSINSFLRGTQSSPQRRLACLPTRASFDWLKEPRTYTASSVLVRARDVNPRHRLTSSLSSIAKGGLGLGTAPSLYPPTHCQRHSEQPRSISTLTTT